VSQTVYIFKWWNKFTPSLYLANLPLYVLKIPFDWLIKRFKLSYRSIRWMQVSHYFRLYGLGKRLLDFNRLFLSTSCPFLLPDMSPTIPKRVNSLPIMTQLIDFVGSVSSILCRQLQLRLRSFRLYLLQGLRNTHRVDAGLDNHPDPKVIYAVRFFLTQWLLVCREWTETMHAAISLWKKSFAPH